MEIVLVLISFVYVEGGREVVIGFVIMISITVVGICSIETFTQGLTF